MFTKNESRARAKNELQIAVINDSRFAVEERNGNLSFNLTQMAKPFGKTPRDWRKTDEAQRYLDEMSVRMKIPTADLLEIRQGGTPEKQGTWANDYRIAIRFAQWLDVGFAIAVDALVGISDDFRMNHNYYFLLNLIKEMLPNEAQLKKLIEE